MWYGANPIEFKYRLGIREWSSDPASTALNARLFNDGFLNDYSTLNRRWDFREIASELLMTNSGIWLLANRFERLGKKVNLAVTFLHEVDPTLDEAYFRGLGRLPASTEPSVPPGQVPVEAK